VRETRIKSFPSPVAADGDVVIVGIDVIEGVTEGNGDGSGEGKLVQTTSKACVEVFEQPTVMSVSSSIIPEHN